MIRYLQCMLRTDGTSVQLSRKIVGGIVVGVVAVPRNEVAVYGDPLLQLIAACKKDQVDVPLQQQQHQISCTVCIYHSSTAFCWPSVVVVGVRGASACV